MRPSEEDGSVCLNKIFDTFSLSFCSYLSSISWFEKLNNIQCCCSLQRSSKSHNLCIKGKISIVVVSLPLTHLSNLCYPWCAYYQYCNSITTTVSYGGGTSDMNVVLTELANYYNSTYTAFMNDLTTASAHSQVSIDLSHRKALKRCIACGEEGSNLRMLT